MARSPRQLSKSKFYHILIRGSDGRDIFKNSSDKERVLHIVSKILEENLMSLYAYCIMDNHAHFVVEELKEDISLVMKRINVSYAAYYNKKYCMKGQVFYDRFKSEAIADFNNMLEVMRFVHNNPVKSGYVKKLCDYQWSSYLEYVQQVNKRLVFHEKILKIFGGEKGDSIDKFIRYMSQDSQDIYMESREGIELLIKSEVDRYLQKNNIKLDELGYKENNIHRDRLILMVNQKGGMSIRKTAEMLMLNRGIVYKVMLENRDND